MPEVGKSLMIKDLGRLYMHSFKLESEDGKESFEPWEGKKAFGWEYMRNESILTGTAREEKATFVRIDKDAPIETSEHDTIHGKKTNLAIFSSEVGGHSYNVAARLLPKDIEPGDAVTLTILGCCSLIGVLKNSG